MRDIDSLRYAFRTVLRNMLEISAVLGYSDPQINRQNLLCRPFRGSLQEVAIEFRQIRTDQNAVEARRTAVFGFLLIGAFARAPAALLTPFTYAQIVPAVLLGFVLFGAVPDLWAVVGTATVIAAGVYVLQRRVGR